MAEASARHCIRRLARNGYAIVYINIHKNILWEHGVHLLYKQAWKRKEVARAVIHGSEVTNYDLLPWYVGKVTEMNPDNVLNMRKPYTSFQTMASQTMIIGSFPRLCHAPANHKEAI